MFLDVGAVADGDGGDVAADDGLEPEGAVVADEDVGADDGVGGLEVVINALHACIGAGRWDMGPPVR